jgi:hypothetical protein
MCDTSDNVESTHHARIVHLAKVRGGDRDVDDKQNDRGQASEPCCPSNQETHGPYTRQSEGRGVPAELGDGVLSGTCFG